MTPETTQAYLRIVNKYAHLFGRPEVRLRFLNNTLARQAANHEKLSAALSRFKFVERSKFYPVVLNWWLYVLIFREIKAFSQSSPEHTRRVWRSDVPYGARVLFHVYRLRLAYGVLGAFALILSAGGLFTFVIKTAQEARAAQESEKEQLAAGSRLRALAHDADYLPDYKPEKVWMVEQKDDFERYSNGLRILREYETANHRRGYYVYKPEGGVTGDELRTDPVGIVYHTSESDILPFTIENNDSIESRSRGLLRYVQEHKSYHYVIDRYGQVHRIVRDDQAANHAGNSVWADSKGVYVGLNESFIGVCFETTVSDELGDEQLTEAQLLAGRLLTQVLRSKHNLDDADCVTHGLVSVNPSNMYVAFHHDWVRNFPFEAMGLSDKYKVSTTSIGVYGFVYTEEIAGYAGGEIWAGARMAEEEFRRRAEAAGSEPAALRRSMMSLFRTQMAQQKTARLAAAGREEPATAESKELKPADSESEGSGG
ncbi:MAG TPA: peptidoglycan recognition family protein [Pyrinomonadaceae bacterium]|nr:peptidoglycan recognition family protein [Pyrinomonadaceae bacterium]